MRTIHLPPLDASIGRGRASSEQVWTCIQWWPLDVSRRWDHVSQVTCLGGRVRYLPWVMVTWYPPPLPSPNPPSPVNKQLWKHSLPPTSFTDGKKWRKPTCMMTGGPGTAVRNAYWGTVGVYWPSGTQVSCDWSRDSPERHLVSPWGCRFYRLLSPTLSRQQSSYNNT